MADIYLDYNATTPIEPRVAEAMLPYLSRHFGNPSSVHAQGVAAKKAVEKARRQVAEMLGCEVEEVVFTSGGSESNNYAIKGVARAYKNKGNHIITSSIEHPAVAEVCRYLEVEGCRITWLPVDASGLVDPEDVEAAITPHTILISVMHANNEVGTVEPIREIAEIGHRHGVLVHSDCAQSVGKIPVQIKELGVDLLSIAGHKLYAPKGIGALYIRTGVKLEKLIHGAAHEMNWRAGTENVLECVGLGEACAMISQNLRAYSEHMKTMRDRLEAGLRQRLPGIRVNGHSERRLPNTLSVSFRGLEANTILSELTTVAASPGAACHADRVDISPVLQAMNVPQEYAIGTVRFSTGRGTTADEVDRAIEETARVVGRLSSVGTTPAAEASPRDVRLTHFTHGLGCACKLRPQLLEEILRRVPLSEDANVLVGPETSDDAAVYRLGPDTAIVQTVDFFTPIVDDPYQFGAVAAANSLSDIYAMGAKPLFALSVVGFPSNRLPLAVLTEILRGAYDKATEAGIAIIGGHTVDDTEPKFGLAVTGVVSPDRIVANTGARDGDALLLTKPIGTGVLSTAMKQGLLDEAQAKLLFDTMAALNREAAEAMQEIGASACTDVTGFGLLGHLLELVRGSGVSAEVYAGSVPLLPGVVDLAASGVVPGGTRDNMDYTAPHVRYDDRVSAVRRLILNDAQTSGGLLIAVAAERADSLMAAMRRAGIAQAAIVGRVGSQRGGEALITIRA